MSTTLWSPNEEIKNNSENEKDVNHLERERERERERVKKKEGVLR